MRQRFPGLKYNTEDMESFVSHCIRYELKCKMQISKCKVKVSKICKTNFWWYIRPASGRDTI